MTRSEVMARVKSSDTAPELRVRKALWQAGLRYRLHVADLPGKPDIVLPGRKTVIFVQGCFWHGHSSCPRSREPKTRQEYWLPKLRRNRERDAENRAALERQGWTVIWAWECETTSPDRLAALAEDLRSMSKK